MDGTYQLCPVNFPSENFPLPSPSIELKIFGYVTGSNQRLYPLFNGEKNEDDSPKNVNKVSNDFVSK